MQISFDPLAQQEAAAVRAMLDALHAQRVGYNPRIPERIVQLHEQIAAHRHEDVAVAAVSDTPFQTMAKLNDAPAPSAAPLDPAPSTAAADLFSTAPAAPPATSATIVPAPLVPSAPIPPAPSAPAAAPSHADFDSTGLPWDERIHSGTKAKNADGTWRARRGLNNPGLVKEVEEELRALMRVSASPLSTSTAPTVMDTASSTSTTVDTTASAPTATEQAVPIPLIPVPPTAATPAVTATAQVEHIPAAPAAPATVPAAPIASVAATGTTPANAATVQPAPSDAPNAATTTSAPPTAPIPTPPAPPAPTATADTAPVTFGTLMTRLAKAVAEKRITTDQVDEIVARHGIAKGQMGQLAAKPDIVQLVSAEVTLLGA